MLTITFIEIPNTALASITEITTGLFASFWPMIAIIGALLIGMMVIGAFISFLRH